MTTKREKQRIFELQSKLCDLGFSYEETDALRRISMTLSRWAERECNGEVEVDDNGKAYSVNQGGHWNNWKITRYPAPNREAGAKRRLYRIIQSHPGWDAYHQADPRGAALYLYRHDDVPVGKSVECIYNQIGICIY